MGGGSDEKPEHVLCLVPFPESRCQDAIALLKRNHPNVKVTWRQVNIQSGNLMNAVSVPDELYETATILVTLTAVPTPDVGKNLKFIHLFSAGINQILEAPIYTDTDLKITTSSGVHGPPISEWTVLQILAHSRSEKKMLEWQREGKWGNSGELHTVRDRDGLRLGVLGYGSIGRQTARVCKAMGMDVIAYTASPRSTPESKKDRGYIPSGLGDPDGSIPSAWYSGLDKASLRNFLSQDIDVLLISVPLTKDTHHFLAAEEFKILGEKKNAFVVNVSRGSIINQDDLIVALKKDLKDGGLSGAALDVTDPEPLPDGHELWGMENVAVTPHVSGLSAAYDRRSFEILSQNITRLHDGKPLINLVDRRKGY